MIKRYCVTFEGGLVVDAARHEMTDDALIFYDEHDTILLRVPAEAIYTYEVIDMNSNVIIPNSHVWVNR